VKITVEAAVSASIEEVWHAWAAADDIKQWNRSVETVPQ
jgi:uncharacterized protein YndB with AHSA1/START domain